MIESLYVGATGMHSQETNLTVIANNLSNVNTTAYKKNRVDFKDLLYRTVSSTNGMLNASQDTLFIGVGSAVSSTGKEFVQGDLKTTNAPLDVAISGEGFFEVILPDGTYAYTRNGTFQLDSTGTISTVDGYPISPMIQVPSDALDITIQTDGRVLVTVPDQNDPVEIGQIDLANFVNATGLEPRGDNLYVPTSESGQVFYGSPAKDGFGELAQGFLEGSNVELIEELLNLILAQRAYEINSRVVQASDEMMSIANSMRS